MKVKLTKDWAQYSKGETVEVTDVAVLTKGFEIKLFEGKCPKNLGGQESTEEETNEMEVTEEVIEEVKPKTEK